MDSLLFTVWVAIVPQVDSPGSTVGPRSPSRVLESIDQTITVSAIVLLLVMCWWHRRTAQGLSAVAPDRPNRLREDAITLAVLVYFTATLVIAAFLSYVLGLKAHPMMPLLVGTGSHVAGIIVCLMLASRQFEGGLRRFWSTADGPTWKNMTAQIVLLSFISLGIAMVVRDVTITLIVQVIPGFEFPIHPTIQALHQGANPRTVTLMIWVSALLIAPLAEEFFFRGLLQSAVLNLLQTGKPVRNRWAAIILASLAFGLVHFPQPQAVPALFALGLILGYGYERTGSILVPVMIHALFNLKTLVWDGLSGM